MRPTLLATCFLLLASTILPAQTQPSASNSNPVALSITIDNLTLARTATTELELEEQRRTLPHQTFSRTSFAGETSYEGTGSPEYLLRHSTPKDTLLLFHTDKPTQKLPKEAFSLKATAKSEKAYLAALSKVYEKLFNVSLTLESRPTELYILTADPKIARNLPKAPQPGYSFSTNTSQGITTSTITGTGKDLATYLSPLLKLPVLDESKLTIPLTFEWSTPENPSPETIIQSLTPLGLSLQKATRKIPALHVDPVPTTKPTN